MKTISTIILIVLSFSIGAHEGHDVPGALPPAPNGGKLGAAEHVDHKGGDHKHDESKELFFEVVYIKGEIKVYPLELNIKDSKIFAKGSMPKDIKIKVKYPRSKVTDDVEIKHKDGHVLGLLKKRKDRRFITLIEFTNNKEKMLAEVMVEKR